MMIVFLLVGLTLCHKTYEERHQLTEFNHHNGWIFLTSFTFEPDLAKIELELKVQGASGLKESQYLIIQGVPQSQWEVDYELRCKGVLKMPVLMQELKMSGEKTTGMLQFDVKKKEAYYFAIKDCHMKLKEYYDDPTMSIIVRITVISNETYQEATKETEKQEGERNHNQQL